MFQNDTELDKYCSGAHKGRPQQLEDPVYPRGNVLFNNPQVPESGTLRRCHKPCIPCLFLYTPASRGISGTLQNPPKGCMGRGPECRPETSPNRYIQGPTWLEAVCCIVPCDIPCSMHTKD